MRKKKSLHININHTIWGKIYNYFIQFSKAFKIVIKKILMLSCLWLVRFIKKFFESDRVGELVVIIWELLG